MPGIFMALPIDNATPSVTPDRQTPGGRGPPNVTCLRAKELAWTKESQRDTRSGDSWYLELPGRVRGVGRGRTRTAGNAHPSPAAGPGLGEEHSKDPRPVRTLASRRGPQRAAASTRGPGGATLAEARPKPQCLLGFSPAPNGTSLSSPFLEIFLLSQSPNPQGLTSIVKPFLPPPPPCSKDSNGKTPPFHCSNQN